LQLVSQQGWQGQGQAISISMSKMTMATKTPNVSVLFFCYGRAVNQDEVEAKRASQDNENRVEQNVIGDGVGHAGNPLFVVHHDNNRRNLDNLSGAGRAAYITRSNEMLQ
jgi:hypothetical protein